MNPTHGTWTKNQDVLPAYIKESIEIMESVENNTAAYLVKNYDDGNNEILPSVQHQTKDHSSRQHTNSIRSVT